MKRIKLIINKYTWSFACWAANTENETTEATNNTKWTKNQENIYLVCDMPCLSKNISNLDSFSSNILIFIL